MAESTAAPGDRSVKPSVRRFQDLLRFRVRHILLVSSLYDSFILAEDGQLNEALLQQFLERNLSHNPDLTRVSTGSAALAIARERRFDLIITSLQVGDMDAQELALKVHQAGLDTPVILLAYNNRDLTDFIAKRDHTALERIFLWQGDVGILLAMVKYLEDRINVEHDTGELGVPVILVVEDNIRFYSSFLPAIYAELMNHQHNLISEGVNLTQKMLRLRARPKILLGANFEEAWEYIAEYGNEMLGIISDIEFPREGKLNRQAGVELARRAREVHPEIPIVLQSSIEENQDLAREVDAWFVQKGSPVMLKQLGRILKENFGFGDFIFRTPDGNEIGRAHDLRSLVEQLKSVPAASIGYHGERNHFSHWLKARTEFALADRLRPRKVSDFPDLEHLREDLVRAIETYRLQRDRVIVADFDRDDFDTSSAISRVGGGSLGGKARGLAFINRLLNESEITERFPGLRLRVPEAVVLGTDIFDEFLEQNNLRQFAIESNSDALTWSRFAGAPFAKDALEDLRAFLREIHYPLAVRSSGLLEDSPNQPFAGVYETYMLPNNAPDLETRLVQLVGAVKRVYSSTFALQAKDFLRVTPYRLEEEKMAVIIQRIVGQTHGNRFYPDFSGVARSHNFYPTPPLKSADGVVAAALGLGRTVVDGNTCLRFSPKYPRHLVAFSSVDDVLRNSQREFYALDLERSPLENDREEGDELSRYGLHVAEQDGTLASLASTYSPDNDVVYDGIGRPGVRLVSFAPILKHQVYPLAAVLEELLELGSLGTSSPVEIEFAGNVAPTNGEQPEFAVLQMRPLALSSEGEELEIGDVLSSQLICRSNSVLGNGSVTDVRDVVLVEHEKFDRARSREVSEHVARFNAELQKRATPYLLIGVGRWGSTDPYLGIPVAWSQIAGARVIVEAGFRDFKVTPSQGTHFFQNLTSCNVGYFTVNPEAGDGFIDWEWLSARPAHAENPPVRHLRFDAPLVIKMVGHKGVGVILKPEGTQ
jgi:CheY-like chemotaxis protein